MNKSTIRITLSDLNIPNLNEETGMINITSKTTHSKQPVVVSSILDEGKVSCNDDEGNTKDTNQNNNTSMQNTNHINTVSGSITKSNKSHTITRKDKALFDLFKNHLENDLRYTDHDFSLKIAARELGTNEKYLSSAINNCSGICFNALVNRYRIAHAKKLIYDDVLTRHNLEEIAYMSGYGNRTTFYRVFTELEGVTPSRFRYNYNKDFTIE